MEIQEPDTTNDLQYSDELTDEQVQALNAVDKYALIEDLVTKLVEQRLGEAGSGVTAEELILVAAYRKWKASPQSVSGAFHYRR